MKTRGPWKVQCDTVILLFLCGLLSELFGERRKLRFSFQKRTAGDELYLPFLTNLRGWRVLKSTAPPVPRWVPPRPSHSTGILLPSCSTRGAGGVTIRTDPTYSLSGTCGCRRSLLRFSVLVPQCLSAFACVSQDFAHSQSERENARDVQKTRWHPGQEIPNNDS